MSERLLSAFLKLDQLAQYFSLHFIIYFSHFFLISLKSRAMQNSTLLQPVTKVFCSYRKMFPFLVFFFHFEVFIFTAQKLGKFVGDMCEFHDPIFWR